MYKIAKEQLPSLFAAIAGRMDLYMPLRKNGQVNYGIWSQEAETALDALNTVKSPKDFFFPQSENLYTCYREGKKISITPRGAGGRALCHFRHPRLRREGNRGAGQGISGGPGGQVL